jgi:ABC-type antimicrobial peptide transport system permease subunit
MIKNYFKIAWRNLVKSKVHSFINISGLSVGMAVAMLIGLWIWDEVSFDQDNPNYDRIAQLYQNQKMNNETGTWNSMPLPLADELRNHYGSNFKDVVLSSWTETHFFTIGEKKITTQGNFIQSMRSNEMFNLHMIQGSRAGLKDPLSIFLSASTAKGLFGNGDPMDKLIRMDDKHNLKVVGVYQDFPTNSEFSNIAFLGQWGIKLANDPWIKTMGNPWRNNSFQIYVELADNSNMPSVTAKIKEAKMKNLPAENRRYHPELFLLPMSKWHLYREFKNGVNVGGRIQYVWLFGIIGVFVLLLACINFMNLSTARSQKRAREVGIRKAIGSLRRQLIGQFYVESVLVAFFALLFGLILVQLLLPFFNEVSGKRMTILWSSPFFWLLCLGFALITGLIAGSYPALYLSSFQPVKVLKGSFSAGRFAALPRKMLVILQFTVSVVLIIGTIVVFRQVQYAKDRPIGYSRDGLVMVPLLTPEIHNHFEAVKDDLKKSGAIAEMAEAGSPTTAVWSTNGGFNWKGKDPSLAVDFPNTNVTFDYGKTVGWQFREGRDFSAAFPTDSMAFILNESAARFMNLKNPVGETIVWDDQPFHVIGVIKDMVVESPYAPARPSIYHIDPSPNSYVLLRINPASNARTALDKIKKTFAAYGPSQPFNFQFADDEYAKKFGDEERIGKLAGFFAALAIFISCLGLFGMASFMAEQRIKEIGVRKVLGASVMNLWGLLSKDFVFLVIISLLIAIPLSWYFMHNWLEHYEYRSTISWWIFVIAATGALVITILTVSYQAIRAALMNPVESLKTE